MESSSILNFHFIPLYFVAMESVTFLKLFDGELKFWMLLQAIIDKEYALSSLLQKFQYNS